MAASRGRSIGATRGANRPRRERAGERRRDGASGGHRRDRAERERETGGERRVRTTRARGDVIILAHVSRSLARRPTDSVESGELSGGAGALHAGNPFFYSSLLEGSTIGQAGEKSSPTNPTCPD